MEGGVAIFVLLVVVVVAIVLGVALYVTGGAIFAVKDREEKPPRGEIDPIEENTSAMRTPEQREHSESPR